MTEAVGGGGDGDGASSKAAVAFSGSGCTSMGHGGISVVSDWHSAIFEVEKAFASSGSPEKGARAEDSDGTLFTTFGASECRWAGLKN